MFSERILNEVPDNLTVVFDLDVECYIKNLPWGDETDEHTRNLVEENLRTYWKVLKGELPPPCAGCLKEKK